MTMLKMNATGLFVNNMAAMVAFYRDVVGMTTDWNGDANADLYSGSVRLMLYGREDFAAMTGKRFAFPDGTNGTMELSFNVPRFADVDAEYTRLVLAGATPVMVPADEPWGQRTSYVADPEGNLIEIGSFGEAA